jgi:hypothetical protein
VAGLGVGVAEAWTEGREEEEGLAGSPALTGSADLTKPSGVVEGAEEGVELFFSAAPIGRHRPIVARQNGEVAFD